MKTVALAFQDVTWPVTFAQLMIHIVNILNDLCAIRAPLCWLLKTELGTLIRSLT